MLYKLLIYLIIIQYRTSHILENYFQCETTHILENYLKSLSRSVAVQNGRWSRVFRVYFDRSCLFNISVWILECSRELEKLYWFVRRTELAESLEECYWCVLMKQEGKRKRSTLESLSSHAQISGTRFFSTLFISKFAQRVTGFLINIGSVCYCYLNNNFHYLNNITHIFKKYK